jgi:hypothetical protein
LQTGHTRCRDETPPNLGVVILGSLWQCHTSQLNREFEMSLKKASLAAMLAVSMAGTPVLAQTAPSAAPESVAARSGAATSDANELRGGFIIPLIALIAIILGILAATRNGDRPESP